MYIKYPTQYTILSHSQSNLESNLITHCLKGDQFLKEFEAVSERLVLTVDGNRIACRDISQIPNPTHHQLIKDAAREIHNYLFYPTLNKLRRELLGVRDHGCFFSHFNWIETQLIQELTRSIMEILDMLFTWESKKPCDIFIQTLPVSTMYDVNMELASIERLPNVPWGEKQKNQKDLLPIYLSIAGTLKRFFKESIHPHDGTVSHVEHTQKLFLKGYKETCILETYLRDKKAIEDGISHTGSTEE